MIRVRAGRATRAARGEWWSRAVLGLLLLALLGLASTELHCFDLFWQMQGGRHMVETGSVLRTDTFSLAHDSPRYEHCWLHDVACFAVHEVAGYRGLSLLKGVLMTLTAALAVLVARQRGAAWSVIACTVPAGFLLTRGAWLARPQLWSFLGTMALIWVLERRHRGRGLGVLWCLPIVLAWVNLHAGAALAYAVGAAYVAGDAIDLVLRRSRTTWRKVGLLTAVGVAAIGLGFANPYGSQFFAKALGTPELGGEAGAESATLTMKDGAAAMERAKSYGPLRQVLNMDWRHTTFVDDPTFFAFAVVAGLMLLAAWRRVSAAEVFLLGGLFLMGSKLSRHTPFFMMACLALLPSLWTRSVRSHPFAYGSWSRRFTRAVPVFALAIFLSVALPSLRLDGFFRTGLREWHYPVEAARFVRRHGLPGNLYNNYAWGGYLAWELFPNYRVFWDGRANSPTMFELGNTVMNGDPGWDRILADRDVRTVVTQACSVAHGQHFKIITLLNRSPDWQLVFAKDSALVFVRKDAVPKPWLTTHTVPETRIDEVLYTLSRHLVTQDPRRFMAWWNIGRIAYARKDYDEAIPALQNHLAQVPFPNPTAEKYLTRAHSQRARFRRRRGR